MSTSLRYWPFPSLAPNGVKPQIAVDYRAALVAADGNRTGWGRQMPRSQVIGEKYHLKQKNDPVLVYHLRHHMRPKKR